MHILILILLLLFSGSQISFSADQKEIVDQMINHGKIALRKGNILSAISDFSRVLTIEQDNITAQQFLLELTHERSLAAHHKIALYQLEDIIRHGKLLTNQIDHYKAKIEILESEIDESTFKEKVIFDPVIENKVNIASNEKFNGDDFSSSTSSITNLINLLLEQNAKREQTLAVLKNMYMVLNHNQDKPKRIVRKSHPIAPIKPATHQESKINKIYFKSDPISQKKNENLNVKNMEIDDLYSRLELNENLLKLKSKEIGQMARDSKFLTKRNKNLNDTLNIREIKLTELNGILKIYQDKLLSSVKELQNRDSARNLIFERITNLKIKSSEREKVLSLVIRELDLIEVEMVEMQKQFIELHSGLDANLKQNVLSNQIEKIITQFNDIHNRLLKQLKEFDRLNAQLVIGGKSQ